MLVYLMMIDSQEDQSKFEKVYLTYRGLMYHVAYKILNNKHDAEDAVHSAFIKIAENIQKIDKSIFDDCGINLDLDKFTTIDVKNLFYKKIF